MGPFSLKSLAQIGPISWHMTVDYYRLYLITNYKLDYTIPLYTWNSIILYRLYCIIIIWVMIFAEKRFKKFSKFLPKWRFTELKGCRNEVLPNWRFENIFSRLPKWKLAEVKVCRNEGLPKWRVAEMKRCRNEGAKRCPPLSIAALSRLEFGLLTSNKSDLPFRAQAFENSKFEALLNMLRNDVFFYFSLFWAKQKMYVQNKQFFIVFRRKSTPCSAA